MAGNVKLAEDRYQNKMQFAHLKCDTAVTITTAGWTITTDSASPLTISSVSGSGTNYPIFTLSRIR